MDGKRKEHNSLQWRRNAGIEERTNFDIVRYANCWEDADILLPALAVKEGGIYLSVSSAGDNTLGILSRKPSLVIAADLSSAQLACLELRVAAFAEFPYEKMLRFLGVREEPNRLGMYKVIYRALSADARTFWDAHPDFVARGVVHVGKFEEYFRIFRKWVMPLIHGRSTVLELMRKKDASARIAFYEDRWNTWRWRAVFKVFFSRALMGRLGRDPELFRYVEGNVAKRILSRVEYALTALSTHDNPYLEYILTGNFENSLPYYLQVANFDAIRNNLKSLVLYKGTVIEAIRANGGLKFDGFNLSDIFEYMSYDQYVSELCEILESSQSGARIVYWNMLAERRPPVTIKDRLGSLEDIADELFRKDKAFFYKALRVEEAI